MKAIVYDTYGSPDVLRLADVAKPAPGDNEVLVKVHAAALNSYDWDRLTGKPYIYRLLFGLLKPKLPILGADVAGTVEAVGQNVKQFQPGDAIFGDLSEGGWGGLAEYVCARETALNLKPAGMTFEQAAAIPQAGVLALQGLRDKRPVQPGQTVLVNGAGGGVGTFAVQMAKSFGAEVTGVDSPAKLAMLRSFGADHVIDYTQEDYTRTGQQYDLIVDVVARRSVADYKRALTPQGTFVVVGGSIATILQTATLGTWFSKSEGQQMSLLMHRPNKDLAFIIALFESGQVVPVIDKCYPLHKAAEAIRYLGAGHAKGKVVITVEGAGDK